jgi:hypothetical protein
MSNVVLHPTTLAAIKTEMDQYEAREARLYIEIATLHSVIAGMRDLCKEALKDCVHPQNIQSTELRRAIALAERHISK